MPQNFATGSSDKNCLTSSYPKNQAGTRSADLESSATQNLALDIPSAEAKQGSLQDENAMLREQVSTLEELLQLYEESAVENEQRLQGMLSDLSEKTHQLDHAQATLQTLQSTLESMGDAVIVVDSECEILFFNPAAQRLFDGDLTASTLDQWKQNHLIFEGDHKAPCLTERLPLSRALAGEQVDSAEIRVENLNSGPVRWLSVNARKIVNSKAHQPSVITGAVAVFRNITTRKQTEKALQRSHQAAQRQTRLLEETLQKLKQTQAQLIHGEKMASLGQTVAGIAHEINNPVSFIHGNLDHTGKAVEDLLSLIHLFQKNYPDPPTDVQLAIQEIDLDFLATDVPQMLISMKNGTHRIREIVKSLRTFVHLDESEEKSIDIHKGIESALVVVSAKLKHQQSRPEIIIHRHYGSCPQIACFASQLNQVFVHLLSNSIDALANVKDTPEITISTHANASAVTVEVQDNGSGIPVEIKDKIFDPFYTTKQVGKGTGLGLTVCHQIIVDMHHGSIDCFSTAGEGSRFVITLPISAAVA